MLCYTTSRISPNVLGAIHVMHDIAKALEYQCSIGYESPVPIVLNTNTQALLVTKHFVFTPSEPLPSLKSELAQHNNDVDRRRT
jgi:hypothetical protein